MRGQSDRFSVDLREGQALEVSDEEAALAPRDDGHLLDRAAHPIDRAIEGLPMPGLRTAQVFDRRVVLGCRIGVGRVGFGMPRWFAGNFPATIP